MSSALSYESIAQRNQPYPVLEEVEVEFDLDDSLTKEYVGDFIDALVMRLTLLIDEAKVKGISDLLFAYLAVILMMRIDYVNSRRIAKRPKDNDLCLPRFFSNILEQIGKVDAVKFGITLKPVLKTDRSEIWTKASQALPIEGLFAKTQNESGEEGEAPQAEPEAQIPSLDQQARWINEATTRLKRVFAQANVKPAICLPVSSQGTLDFMVLQCRKQVVYGNRDDIPPLFALFAAVVGVHQKAGIFFPGVNYGTFAQMRESVRLVAQLDTDNREQKDVNSGSGSRK